MPKERLNLLVERTAIERGRRYSEAHRTSISRLVSDFLSRLPVGEQPHEEALTPTVQRLLGAARGAEREEYRRHLIEKYGR